MPIVNCQICKKAFSAKPSWIKNGYGKYCSRACQNTGARKGKEVPCDTCNKLSYKSPKALRGSKSGKFFCSKTCQTRWRNVEFSKEKHPNWKGGTHAYRRMLSQSDRPQVCGHCKTDDVRVLAVHHLDENRKNNTLENLAWLCHNCHHLIHYYPDETKRYMATIV